MTTIKPLAQSYTRDTFTKYVEGEVESKMRAWRPQGFVLHNTGAPKLDQFYKSGAKPLSGEQRVKNMWVSYQNQGWSGGPHLVVTDREILTGNPLWLKGTHSPSWNSTFWGLEMAGDFDVEKFPDALRDNAVHAMACCYAMLGRPPTDTTFHFHKEDVRTTHKHCPGRNVPQKSWWLDAISKAMRGLHPGDCACGDHSKALTS